MNNNNNNNQVSQEQASHNQAVFRAKQEHFLGLCHKVFKLNKDGAELLAYLSESLVETLPVADPDKDANHAFYREGQNSVVRFMYQNIKAYEKVMEQNAKKTMENQ